MAKEGVEIKRLFGAGDLEKGFFAFTGYESKERYQAKKVESEKRVALSLELVKLKAPYVKKWDQGPSQVERLREMIAKGLSYGAYVGDRMVGLLVMERRVWNDTLHIEDLEVMPDWWGQGVGRLLMARAEEVARALGVRAISLETQNTNVPAIRFYRRNGYEIDGIDLSLYTNSDARDGEVALIMKKKLR